MSRLIRVSSHVTLLSAPMPAWLWVTSWRRHHHCSTASGLTLSTDLGLVDALSPPRRHLYLRDKRKAHQAPCSATRVRSRSIYIHIFPFSLPLFSFFWYLGLGKMRLLLQAGHTRGGARCDRCCQTGKSRNQRHFQKRRQTRPIPRSTRGPGHPQSLELLTAPLVSRAGSSTTPDRPTMWGGGQWRRMHCIALPMRVCLARFCFEIMCAQGVGDHREAAIAGKTTITLCVLISSSISTPNG